MRVVMLALGAILLLARAAAAANYLLVCGPSACTASDGTTQAAGTALSRIVWDGATPYTPPAGMQAIPDDGRAVYQPARKAPVSIGSFGFIARFTAAEQQAIQTAAQTNWQVQLWMTQLAASGTVSVTNATVTQGMAELVALNLLTAARSAQILNLAVSSP